MASDQLSIDVLLGKLNSFLFRFNSDENTRNNIKYAIQQFYKIPAVKYWLSLEKKYQEEQKGNHTMGIKSFKGWLAEQSDEPMARNIVTTTTEERSPRSKTQKKTRKPRRTTEEKDSSGITISFNDSGEAEVSMDRVSFDNLKSLDGLLE